MRLMAAAAFALLAVSSQAAACDEGDQALFACSVFEDGKGPDESQSGFRLCGGHDGDAPEWTRVYYEFRTPEGVAFRYPDDPSQGRTRFFTHHYRENGLYRFRVRFASGAYSYVIYLDETPAASEPDTINGPDPGVRVYKGKELIADHGCSEAPETYYSYIFEATSCDLDNPRGKLACDDMKPPEIK